MNKLLHVITLVNVGLSFVSIVQGDGLRAIGHMVTAIFVVVYSQVDIL